MPINGGLDKEDVVYMYNGILLRCKKRMKLPLAAMWMDIRNIMLNEIRKILYNFTYLWNIKKIIQVSMYAEQKDT